MNERVTTLINKSTNANDNFKTELTFVWAPKCSLQGDGVIDGIYEKIQR